MPGQDVRVIADGKFGAASRRECAVSLTGYEGFSIGGNLRDFWAWALGDLR